MVDSANTTTGDNTYPSTDKTAFACPFCGAYTTQYWYSLYAKKGEDNSLPVVPKERPESAFEDFPKEFREGHKEFWHSLVKQYSLGKIILGEETESRYVKDANNINFSKCYNCEEFSVWIYDRLVFPAKRTGPPPNEDLPESIKADYEEARTILNLSPRGAAALLRLCIQKLCIHLGAGENLSKAIGKLKKEGLKQKVIDSLDIVRVIGNEAVHPGTIDLNDNKDDAEALFGLVNIITEELISEDKHINALYSKLPESKRKQIEQRDQINTLPKNP